MIISLYCLCSGSTDTVLLFMSFSLLDLDSRRLVEQIFVLQDCKCIVSVQPHQSDYAPSMT